MTGPVFLFPGQGSQAVGMGKSFYDAYPSIRDLFDRASSLLSKDLRTLCFDGPAADLMETQNVQPAITLVNIACWHVLRDEGELPAAVAGHSLGELSALYAAGVLSFDDTIRLVGVRGSAMKDAADRHPGGMVAVLGLDFEAASDVCREVSSMGIGSVEVANQNSPTQIVLTGEKAALDKVPEIAKGRGAKLIVPLKVSGPWHSRFMADATGRMRDALSQTTIGRPSLPVWANVTAETYPDKDEEIRERLVQQLTRPVMWASSMRRLVEQGHRVFVEVGPGKVLSGLLRDVSREVKVFNVQDVESLQKWQAARIGLLG